MEKFTNKVASILMSLSIILISSCAQRVTVVDENASTEKFIINDDETVVRTTKDVLGKMSLREKVGQLFIVRPEALAENSNAVRGGRNDLDVLADNQSACCAIGIIADTNHRTIVRKCCVIIACRGNCSTTSQG